MIAVANVTNSSSFGAWLATTNRIAEILSQNTVTIDTSSGGSLSTGNGFVSGYFGANYLVVKSALIGGNVSTNGAILVLSNTSFSNSVSNLVSVTSNTSQSVFTVSTNNAVVNSNSVSISGQSISLNGEVQLNSIVREYSNSVLLTSASPVVIDVTPIAVSRSIEYIIQATSVSNTYHVTKLLVIHDGTTAFLTEYGTLFTSSSLINLDCSIVGSNLNLTCTTVASTNTVIKMFKKAVAV